MISQVRDNQQSTISNRQSAILVFSVPLFSVPPCLRGEWLRLRPGPLRNDYGRNPSPRTKVPFNFSPNRLSTPHHVFQDPVDNVFLENSEVPVELQVFL